MGRPEPPKAPIGDFAHPVERELARLFDEHGLEWEYEPHCFVLERDADGAVREAFTPDFYLPQLDLYVECTVMKQARTNRKRSKVRRAREAGIPVELLYRRDFTRLASKWRLERLAGAVEEAARGFEAGPTGHPVPDD